MGQCKSKVGALPGVDDQDSAVLKARKSNKRKWRKSKGYSLSASLDGDLHCNEEEMRKRREEVGKNHSLFFKNSKLLRFFS